VLKKYLLTLFLTFSDLRLKFFNSGNDKFNNFSPSLSKERELGYLSLRAIGFEEVKI
jgi:hypothetical protein